MDVYRGIRRVSHGGHLPLLSYPTVAQAEPPSALNRRSPLTFDGPKRLALHTHETIRWLMTPLPPTFPSLANRSSSGISKLQSCDSSESPRIGGNKLWPFTHRPSTSMPVLRPAGSSVKPSMTPTGKRSHR